MAGKANLWLKGGRKRVEDSGKRNVILFLTTDYTDLMDRRVPLTMPRRSQATVGFHRQGSPTPRSKGKNRWSRMKPPKKFHDHICIKKDSHGNLLYFSARYSSNASLSSSLLGEAMPTYWSMDKGILLTFIFCEDGCSFSYLI